MRVEERKTRTEVEMWKEREKGWGRKACSEALGEGERQSRSGKERESIGPRSIQPMLPLA